MNAATRRKLQAMEQQLLAAPRRPLCSGPAWAAGIRDAPGVYAVWEARTGKAIYVGETSCLSKRMADLGRWRNHTCRRKLGANLDYDGSDGAGLSAHLARKYVVSCIPVSFGRAELEEYLYLRWKAGLINAVPKRIHSTQQYQWVTRETFRKTRNDQ